MNNFGLGLILSLTDNLSSGVGNAINSLEGLISTLEHVDSTANSLSLMSLCVIAEQVGDAFESAGQAILGTFSSAFEKIMETGSMFEDYRVQIGALYGDLKNTSGIVDEVMGKMVNFAVESPVDMSELMPYLVKFKSLGVDAFDSFASKQSGMQQSLLNWTTDFLSMFANENPTRMSKAIMGFLNPENARGLTIMKNLLGDVEGRLADVGDTLSDTVEGRVQNLISLVNGLGAEGITTELMGNWSTLLSNMEDVFMQFWGGIADGGAFDSVKRSLNEIVVALNNVDTAKFGQVIADGLKIITVPLERLASLTAKVISGFTKFAEVHPVFVRVAIGAVAVVGALLLLSGVVLKLGAQFGMLSVGIGMTMTMLGTFKGGSVLATLTGLGAKLKLLTIALTAFYILWNRDFGGIKTKTISFVNNVKSSFSQAKAILNANCHDMRIALDSLNPRNPFENFTRGLVKLGVLIGAVKEGFANQDGANFLLSEDTYNKLVLLGLDNLVGRIFDAKYAFDRFVDGFKNGWTAVSEYVGGLIDKLKTGIKGTFLESIITQISKIGDIADRNSFFGMFEKAGEIAGKLAPIAISLLGISKVLQTFTSFTGFIPLLTSGLSSIPSILGSVLGAGSIGGSGIVASLASTLSGVLTLAFSHLSPTGILSGAMSLFTNVGTIFTGKVGGGITKALAGTIKIGSGWTAKAGYAINDGVNLLANLTKNKLISFTSKVNMFSRSNPFKALITSWTIDGSITREGGGLLNGLLNLVDSTKGKLAEKIVSMMDSSGRLIHGNGIFSKMIGGLSKFDFNPFPHLLAGLESLGKSNKIFSKAIDFFKTLSGGFNVNNLFSGFGTLINKSITAPLKLLTSPLKLLGKLFGLLTSPIGLVVVAITAIGTAFGQAYDKVSWFKDWVNNSLGLTKDLDFSTMFDGLKGGFLGMWENLKTVFSDLISFDWLFDGLNLKGGDGMFASLFDTNGLMGAVGDLFGGGEKKEFSIKGLLEDVKSSLLDFWNTISPVVAYLGVMFADFSQLVFDAIGLIGIGVGILSHIIAPVLQGVISQIVIVVSSAWEVVKGFIGILSGIVTYIIGVAEVIKGIITFIATGDTSGIENGFSKMLSGGGKILDGIKGIFGGIVDFLLGTVGNFISMGANIIDGLVEGVMSSWNAITEVFRNLVNHVITFVKDLFGIHSPSTVFAEIGGYIIQGLINGVQNMISFVVQTFNNVVTGVKAVFFGIADYFLNIGTSIATFFSNGFQLAYNLIVGIFSGFAGYFSGIWNAVVGLFSGDLSPMEFFGTVFQEAYDLVTGIFSSLGEFFSGVWQNIVDLFTGIGTTVGEAISNVVSTAVNSVLSTAVTIINGFINAINFALGVINEIPGVSISKLDKLSVPQMARGGVVDSATLAVVGEAGKEAVMPLENNTQWIDTLAGKIGGVISKGDSVSSLVTTFKDFLTGAVGALSNTARMSTNGGIPVIIDTSTRSDSSLGYTPMTPVVTNNGGSTYNSSVTTGGNYITKTSTNTSTGDTDNSVVFESGSIVIQTSGASEAEAERIANMIMKKIERKSQIRNMTNYKFIAE